MRDERLVYSTDGGRIAASPTQGKRQASTGRPTKKPPAKAIVPDDGVVRIFRQRAVRGGKPLTVIRGLRDRGPALDALAFELKRLCGAGGAVRDGAIELQGDHRERIAEHLRKRGDRVKLAGG
jgi:translation initiation factor 1